MKKPDIPVSVEKVRRLMLLYVAVILLGTVVFAISTGFMEKRELFRGLLRVAAFSYLIWWLPSLDRRARWTSVIACGLLTAIGILALLLFLIAGGVHGLGLAWTAIKIVLPVYALAHAFIILMHSETRQHFEA